MHKIDSLEKNYPFTLGDYGFTVLAPVARFGALGR